VHGIDLAVERRQLGLDARNSWRAFDGDRSSVHGSSGIAALN
jgi:hypothetical protein